MIYKSPYKIDEIVEILRNEVDNFPSFLKCLFSLNIHYFKGTSPVCGIILNDGFKLRNRRGHHFSVRAHGKMVESKKGDGTIISLEFKEPKIPEFSVRFLKYCKTDEDVIIGFLKECLNIK